MKSMSLLAPGIMVSLSALILTASIASTAVRAQPPRADAQGWSMPRVGASPPSVGRLPGGPNPAVPRGDLRGDIVDHARQRAAPPRPEPPERQHH
jgi:hypothetical protein